MKRNFDKEQFDLGTFIDSIVSQSIKDKIYATEHKDGKLTIFISQNLTAEEDTELASTVESHNGQPLPPLRVYRVIPRDANPLITDFSILGFRKMAPYYDRGRKDKALYMCVDKEEIIVEKIFKDIRNDDGRLTDLEITFNWYREDGTIGLSKKEIAKSYNKSEAKTEERKRRERQLDFLLAEGEDSAAAPILDDIFEHYYEQILHYKENGSSILADAINADSDPNNEDADEQIAFYLTIRVPLAAMPDTHNVPIKEAILYQIGAISDAELMATVQLNQP